MAFAKRNVSTDADLAEIAPIDADPRYAAESLVLNQLITTRRRLEKKIERLKLEIYCGGTDFDPKRDRDVQIRDRLKILREEEPKSEETMPTPSTVDGRPEAVTRGLEIVRGLDPVRVVELPGQIKKLTEHVAILGAAVGAQTAIVDGIKDTLSFQLCQRLRETNKALLRSVYEASMAFIAAATAERQLKARIIGAGFELRWDILEAPILPECVTIGTLDQFSSRISEFRRQLTRLGVL